LSSGGGGGAGSEVSDEQVSAGGGAGMQLYVQSVNNSSTLEIEKGKKSLDFGGGCSFPYGTLTMNHDAVDPTDFCHALNIEFLPILRQCYRNGDLEVKGGGSGGGGIFDVKNKNRYFRWIMALAFLLSTTQPHLTSSMVKNQSIKGSLRRENKRLP